MNMEDKNLVMYGIRKSEKNTGYTIITLISKDKVANDYFEGYNEETYFYGKELFEKIKGKSYIGKDVTLKYHIESRGTAMRKVADEIIIDGKNILA